MCTKETPKQGTGLKNYNRYYRAGMTYKEKLALDRRIAHDRKYFKP